MKTTIEYLDALKEHFNVSSDYALAAKMGVPRTQISSYRTGRSRFDDYMAARTAEILKLDPLEVIARINAERETRPEVKSYWERMARAVHNGIHTLMIAVILSGAALSNFAESSTAYISAKAGTVSIMLSKLVTAITGLEAGADLPDNVMLA